MKSVAEEYKYVGPVIIHDTPWGFPVMYPHDAKPSPEELVRAVIDYLERQGGGADHGR